MNNEELVEKRLSEIESKIDKLTELMTQTQLQEYRLSVLEKQQKEMHISLSKLESRAGDTALKWLGIIGGGIVTILLGFIAVRLGLK